MRALATAVKETLIPGTMSFLLAGLGIGVVLLNVGGEAGPVARVWITALLGFYGVLSLPVVAHFLIAQLHHGFGTIGSPQDANGAAVLVVIGNGSVHYEASGFAADMLTRRSYFCVFEAARLWTILRPEWLVVSGGVAGLNPRAKPEAHLLKDAIVGYGVPSERVLVEADSRTTEEQLANVKRLLARHGLVGSIVIITTGAHMSRVMALARREGLDAAASVTPELRYDDGRTGWGLWWPSFAALAGSQSALYEYLAHVYRIMK